MLRDPASIKADMTDILKVAEAENRGLKVAESERFDALDREWHEARMSGSHTETRGVSAPSSDRPEGYTGDTEVRGQVGEILRSDQSVSAWLEKRRNGNVAHDVDWNAYWAQRMGLRKPGLEMRALGEDTSSGNGAGNAVVPVEYSTSFIDLLRPALVIGRAGCSVMPMEHEVFNYPQYVADVSPTWLAEGTALTLDANPQFSTLQFNAQGAFTDLTLFSRQLAEDTNQSGGLSGLLQQTIGQKFGRVMDQAALYGVTGNSGNPGLVNESNLVVQPLGGTANTAGTALTDTQFVSTAAQAVRNANAEPTAIVTNPSVAGSVARLNASTYAKYWDMPSDVAHLPWITSTALASNETLGSGTALSSLYVADWSKMIVGIRVDLDVRVLNERYADSNQIGLLSYMRFSVRTSHPEAAVRVKGIKTT